MNTMLIDDKTKKLLFDIFAWTIKQKYHINISSLQNSADLINFIKIVHQVYNSIAQYRSKTQSPENNIHRLKKELKQLCEKYANVLPEEFPKLTEHIDENFCEFLQKFCLRILSLWTNLGTVYEVVETVLYIVQYYGVINTKRELEELLKAGYSYGEINQIFEKLEVLRDKAETLKGLVEEYQSSSSESADHCLQQKIRHQLNETNEQHYEPLMRDVEKLRQTIEEENAFLLSRLNSFGYFEKMAYIVGGTGVVLTLSSHSKRFNTANQIHPALGMAAAAVSVVSLGYSAIMKRRLDARLELVKGRLDRLAQVDLQLAQIKVMLVEFEEAFN